MIAWLVIFFFQLVHSVDSIGEFVWLDHVVGSFGWHVWLVNSVDSND